MRLKPLRVPVLCLITLFVLGGCSRSGVERVEWTTMSTIAAVQWDGRGADIAACRATVQAEFSEVERLLNAHQPESELSRLAPLADAQVLAKCDQRVRECYAAAFRLRDETGGKFNPRWRGQGTLDLGAIAKGFAVDLAGVSALRGPETPSGRLLIDLGGNLKAVRGDWKVGILGGGEFTLHEGEACATSSRQFRGNHIADGQSGEPVENSIASVTVIHPKSAMLADGLSTVMFILGRDEGEKFLKEHYPDARAIWYNIPK